MAGAKSWLKEKKCLELDLTKGKENMKANKSQPLLLSTGRNNSNLILSNNNIPFSKTISFSLATFIFVLLIPVYNKYAH